MRVTSLISKQTNNQQWSLINVMPFLNVIHIFILLCELLLMCYLIKCDLDYSENDSILFRSGFLFTWQVKKRCWILLRYYTDKKMQACCSVYRKSWQFPSHNNVYQTVSLKFLHNCSASGAVLVFFFQWDIFPTHAIHYVVCAYFSAAKAVFPSLKKAFY